MFRRASRRPVAGSEIVEAVQQVVGLLGGAAVEVDAAGGIEHHAVHQRQRIAKILRRRIRHGQDLDVVELLLVGGLLQIDRRRRIGHVDRFGELLQVIQGDGQLAGAGPERGGGAGIDEESLALGADGELAGDRKLQREIAGDVGNGLPRFLGAGGAKLHSGARHGDAGLINHSAGEIDLCGIHSRLPGKTGKEKSKNQPELGVSRAHS